jgi:DnaJ-class molecular chaperone
MADPYSILGVAKTASADEIKSAYRKLAKKLHPDVNPGRKDIEQKFKEVTAAYDLLSDKEKRARFDRGEIDAQGQERGFSGRGGNPFGGGGAQWRQQRGAGGEDPFSQFGGMEGMEDIFAQFMGGGRGRKAGGMPPPRGNDVTYSLAVPFTEAVLGSKRRVTLSSGKTIDVTVPAGTDDGNKLRLRGQGEEGPGGAGDAIIEMRIEPHPYFTRKDNDITLEAPISLPEAVLGASVKVPTLDGSVAVKVPANSSSGTILRLKGKGVPAAGKNAAGDMFVKLKIVLPETPSEDLATAMEKWAKKNDYDPRIKMGW